MPKKRFGRLSRCFGQLKSVKKIKTQNISSSLGKRWENILAQYQFLYLRCLLIHCLLLLFHQNYLNQFPFCWELLSIGMSGYLASVLFDRIHWNVSN